MSNHNMAESYIEKHKLLGIDIGLELELLDNDRVNLVKVRDVKNSDKVVIPSFVTDINLSGEYTSALKCCKYSEIYVDNKEGVEFNASELCREMESDSIKVEFRYPECITNMSKMFKGCSARYIDISGIDTRNVVDMSQLFCDCSELVWVKFSGDIDTRKVVDMTHMFNGCMSINSIDLSKFKTGKLSKMYGMFGFCYSLKSVDISSFDTSRVKSMHGLFEMCSSLEDIDISMLDMGNVEILSNMFRGCKALKELDLSKLDLRKVLDIKGIVGGCESIEGIKLPEYKNRSLYVNWDLRLDY